MIMVIDMSKTRVYTIILFKNQYYVNLIDNQKTVL